MILHAVSDTRVIITLALLYVFRMLGLFMVFPVLSVAGADYAGATPFLLGVALGGYGVTQAVLQIPLGLLSDYVGRKPVIIGGFCIFILGSVIAASADSVWGLVIGRFIQGAGAIASAVMALLTDLTSEKNRTKAMAVIGISIGVSFTIAMILGPLLAGNFGLSSIFWLSAMLALAGIAIVSFLVPTPSAANKASEHRPVKGLLLQVLGDRDLLRLNFGITALHFALTAIFVVAPISLQQAGVASDAQWAVYLPVMLGSFVLMLPFIYLAERRKQLKRVFIGAIAALVVAEVAMIFSHTRLQWVAALVLFFIAFNLLEASLPSLVSKLAPAGGKGTAMGVFSMSQFLGASLGGITGGALYGVIGGAETLIAAACVCVVWGGVALGMKPPRFLESLAVPCSFPVDEHELKSNVPGVVEAHWSADQKMLFIKAEGHDFDKSLLTQYLGQVA